jgi:acetylornithine/N-succinyldiaminopimelate aminotransferase
VEIGSAAKDVVARLLDRGYIANAAHDTVLRLLPPLNISHQDIDEFLAALDAVMSEVESSGQ